MSFNTASQSPTQRADAEIARQMQIAMSLRDGQLQEARALQDQARAAQNQARAAQDQARAAQDQARLQADEAQRQVREQLEQAQREIDRAVREAGERAGRSSSGTQVVFPPPFPGGAQIPEGAVVISVAFFVMCAVIAVGLPISRAFGRRVDRRSTVAPSADADTRARLERIEQAVDAIAVEVERISEGQRYTTKILGDFRALPQPEPSVAVPDRVAVPISRAREAR